MHRFAAALTTSFLVFFSVMFGVRFWQAGTSPFKAQVSQSQVVFLPNSFDNQLSNMLSGPDGNIWMRSLANPYGFIRVKPDNTMANAILWRNDMQSVGDGGVQVFGGKVWAELCGVQNYRFYCELSSITSDGVITALRRYDDGNSVNHADWQWGLFPGPDGFLWAFSEGNSYKVSPSGEFTPFAITPPSLPPGFVYSFGKPSSRVMSKGGDGNMWEFIQGNDAGGQPQNYFVSITPQGISTPYLIPKPSGVNDGTCPQHPYYASGFAKPTLGSDGNIWYAINAYCAAGSAYPIKSEIGKVLSDGTMQTFPLPNGVGIGKMIPGPDGNVWFIYANYSNAGSYGIGKITPQGDITLTPVPNYTLGDIATGAGGNIWFVTSAPQVKIGKVMLSASQSSFEYNSIASVPFSSSSRTSSRSSYAAVSNDRCGNGVINTNEACDDGNADGDDGCSASCQLERGYSCSGGYCYVVCGDGIVMGQEQCDDNNRASGDGCSAVCLNEGSGTNTSFNSTLTTGTCGNGFSNAGEQCDDGNRTGGDGCSPQCVLEDGFSCYGSACAPVCGDGKKRGAEECDDSNRTSGDGCSNFCRLETGYQCIGSSCYVVCGDGVTLGSEQCDDGNTASNDGCAANCRTETNWVCGGRPSRCFYSPPPQPASSAAFSATQAPPSSSNTSSLSSVRQLSFVSSFSSWPSYSFASSSNGPFLLPDWLTPRSSSVASSSAVSSSSFSSESSESSSESSSFVSSSAESSSEESSSDSSSSASSLRIVCGNGLQEEGEECDAGSLNGTPVTSCTITCEYLKPAADASSSLSTGIVTQAAGGMNPFVLMFVIAFVVILIGGIGIFVWVKINGVGSLQK